MQSAICGLWEVLVHRTTDDEDESRITTSRLSAGDGAPDDPAMRNGSAAPTHFIATAYPMDLPGDRAERMSAMEKSPEWRHNGRTDLDYDQTNSSL